MISVANIVEICDKTKNRTIITFGIGISFLFWQYYTLLLLVFLGHNWSQYGCKWVRIRAPTSVKDNGVLYLIRLRNPFQYCERSFSVKKSSLNSGWVSLYSVPRLAKVALIASERVAESNVCFDRIWYTSKKSFIRLFPSDNEIIAWNFSATTVSNE